MFHTWAQVIGDVDEEMAGHRGSQLSLWGQEFYETDRTRGFVRGFTFQFIRGLGVGTGAVQTEAKGMLPWGDGHHDVFRGLAGHRMHVGSCIEGLPEEHNCVTLDAVLTDGHAILAPRIEYQIGENTNRMLDFAIARGRKILQAASARNVHAVRPVVYADWHLLGTARMGNDPARSVVNTWGRSHDVKNFFIVDGSIFVTSGGANPTSTIHALALYVADSLKQRLATQFD